MKLFAAIFLATLFCSCTNIHGYGGKVLMWKDRNCTYLVGKVAVMDCKF